MKGKPSKVDGDILSRKTRSGRDFSMWDGLHVTAANADFNLQDLLRAGIARDDLLDTLGPGSADYPETATALEELIVSPPPPPPPLPPPPLPSPAPPHPSSILSKLDLTLTGKERRKARAKIQSRNSRSRQRDGESVESFSNHAARPEVTKKYVVANNACNTLMSTENANVASTGYVALDDGDRSRRTYRLAELVGPDSNFNFQLLRYKKGVPIPLVSKDGEQYIIGVVAGSPDDESWSSVVDDATASLEDARARCHVPLADQAHRRGDFATIRCGVSHGGGQTQPSNLSNNKINSQIADELNSKESFQRIAGFATSVLATWFPLIYDHYVDRLGALHAHYPGLRRNFPGSVFAATTYNLGPQTTCLRHFDIANLPYGMCAVTALGNYDYTKGGHLILWEAHLVIEFPPGVTILLPSAIISHSNTAISPHEHRTSFTQYTAGGIFRWVDNDYQTSVSKKATLTRAEKVEYERRAQLRWAFGLSLLPRLEDVKKLQSTI